MKTVKLPNSNDLINLKFNLIKICLFFLDVNGNSEQLIKLSKTYNLSSNEILELFVYNDKGKIKLLIDEGVYTKNRHFRLLGSSKQNKNIPLVPSENNKYKPNDVKNINECNLFEDSLVTCFSWTVSRILEFDNFENTKQQKTKLSMTTACKEKIISSSSVYPEIDSFINKLIFPNGSIRRKTFFCEKSSILYEIQGYRYCDNIKRQHKSNNITFIIDLSCLAYYQKCYDPDCYNYRSDKKPLPEEIKFLFDDRLNGDTFEFVYDFDDDDDDINNVMEIPKFESSDEEMEKVLEKVVDEVEKVINKSEKTKTFVNINR